MLSLFPGIGLLDLAFERAGFTVVRGPDAIWGGDARRFHAPRGVFEGVIGGPPCQTHSSASQIVGTDAIDLIPEFARIVDEAAPAWVLMENVLGARRARTVPREWYPSVLRDWDCGGHTSRRRIFWTWPFPLLIPARAHGRPAFAVMSSTHKRGNSRERSYAAEKSFLPGDLPLEEYARLQGCPSIVEALEGFGFSRRVIVQLIGNGVPLAMGQYVARQCWEYGRGSDGDDRTV